MHSCELKWKNRKRRDPRQKGWNQAEPYPASKEWIRYASMTAKTMMSQGGGNPGRTRKNQSEQHYVTTARSQVSRSPRLTSKIPNVSNSVTKTQTQDVRRIVMTPKNPCARSPRPKLPSPSVQNFEPKGTSPNELRRSPTVRRLIQIDSILAPTAQSQGDRSFAATCSIQSLQNPTPKTKIHIVRNFGATVPSPSSRSPGQTGSCQECYG